MRDRFRLGGLGNDELLAALSTLVQREHELLSDFLAHLAELDERQLFLGLGFPSLFAYCTEALGLSKSSAGRRIAAARVCRTYPDAFARAARGELQLSVLCELGKHLNPENATELFEACSRKSYEQVEGLLAMRFPKPNVRDLIRRLPVRAGDCTPDVGSGQDVPAVVDTGAEQNSSVIPQLAPTAVPARRALEPLSADRFGVHFTADTEFRELLAEVRALASHRYPVLDLLTVMRCGLEAYRRELQKERFAVGCKPRRAGHARPTASGSTVRTRYVPAAVARAVYLRDGGCCGFVSPDGRRCGARQFLELDHIKPWAEGGESTVENLRLRCRGHNQHAAREHFGSGYIRAAVARARKHALK